MKREAVMAGELSWTQFQEALRADGFYTGPIDGLPNPDTIAAMGRRFDREATAGRLAAGWQSWSQARCKLAVEQSILRDAGIEVGQIDGLVGPQTRFAREAFHHQASTGTPLALPERDETPAKPIPPSGKATIWPRQDDCVGFYGPVNSNQVILKLPYEMRLAWEPKTRISRFSCHAKVHDAFLRVFTRTLQHYGEARLRELRLDLFGGCLNVRKMRGGTRMSMHSWGIAVDIDPDNNTLKMGRDRASLARSEYEPFWGIVEDEGLVSLGRQQNFDWMHFQAARL
jgi:hypothetical protein